MSELEPDAGHALDALIAEQVMGWKVDPFQEGGNITTCYPDRRREHGYWIHEMQLGNGGWSPSRDIAAAWEVVEKLRTDTYWLQIATCNAGWNVQIGEIGKFLQHVVDVAGTLPLAICRAALKTVAAREDSQ